MHGCPMSRGVNEVNTESHRNRELSNFNAWNPPRQHVIRSDGWLSHCVRSPDIGHPYRFFCGRRCDGDLWHRSRESEGAARAAHECSNSSAQSRARNEVKRERVTPSEVARLVWHHLW